MIRKKAIVDPKGPDKHSQAWQGTKTPVKLSDGVIEGFKKGIDILYHSAAKGSRYEGEDIEIDDFIINSLTNFKRRPPTLAQCKSALRLVGWKVKPIEGKKWRGNLSQVETKLLDCLKTYETFIAGSDVGKSDIGAAHGETRRMNTLVKELKVKTDEGHVMDDSPKRRLAKANAERKSYNVALKAVGNNPSVVALLEKTSGSATQRNLDNATNAVGDWEGRGAIILGIKLPTDRTGKNKCYDATKDEEKTKGITNRACPKYVIKHRNALLGIYEDIQKERKAAFKKDKGGSVGKGPLAGTKMPTPYDAKVRKDPASWKLQELRKAHPEVEKLFAPSDIVGAGGKVKVAKDVAEMFMKKKE